MPNMLRTIALILLFVLLSSAGHILIRLGAREAGALPTASHVTFWLHTVCDPRIILGLLIWVGSTVLWIWVLGRTQLSFAYSLASLTYIVVPMFSYWLFQEPLSPLKVTGLILIVAGVATTIAARALDVGNAP